MARGGIYKSEVLRARDNLLALGRYPSIDAIRQELGNTGSKGTIQKYLKEIEEEKGGKTGTKVAISEALQDLVARLAERLHIEADARIKELAAKHADELAASRQERDAAKAEIAELNKKLEKIQKGFAEEQARHQHVAERLQDETVAHASTTQQVVDLQDRLQAEQEHRQSLEEKHTHAREALEHFRGAAKEQREQEQRQHEQQVQYLQSEVKTLRDLLAQKQNEVAISNKECARLVTELSQAERSLQDARRELHNLKDAKAELTSVQQELDRLGHRLVELEAQAKLLEDRNGELEAGRAEDQTRLQQLQIDLAAARATIETQEQLAEKIQSWMIQQKTDLSSQTASTERAAKPRS